MEEDAAHQTMKLMEDSDTRHFWSELRMLDKT